MSNHDQVMNDQISEQVCFGWAAGAKALVQMYVHNCLEYLLSSKHPGDVFPLHNDLTFFSKVLQKL